jgi:hypothetical protein
MFNPTQTNPSNIYSDGSGYVPMNATPQQANYAFGAGGNPSTINAYQGTPIINAANLS